MPQPRPTTILFDLDGTLVDTIELIMQSMEFAFMDFPGPRPSRAKWLEGLGITLRIQLGDWARTPEEHDALIARYRIYQTEHFNHMTTAYPGVAEALDELHAAGHPMGVVTSKYHALANRVIAHVGFSKYFSIVIGGDSIANPKPHPEPVLKALAELGVPATSAMFVGDSPHDMNAGNAAGVETVAALWGPFSREQIAVARPTHWLIGIDALPGLARGQQPTPQH